MVAYASDYGRIGVHLDEVVVHAEVIADDVEKRRPHSAKDRVRVFPRLDRAAIAFHVGVLWVGPIRAFYFGNVRCIGEYSRLVVGFFRFATHGIESG